MMQQNHKIQAKAEIASMLSVIVHHCSGEDVATYHKVYPSLPGPPSHVAQQPGRPGGRLGWREPLLVRQGSGHNRGVQAERGVPYRPGQQWPAGAARRGCGCPIRVRH